MAFNSKISSIPTITSSAQLEQMMQVWKVSLGRVLKQAVPAPPPHNFVATSVRGGIQLTWGLTNPISKKNPLGVGITPSGPGPDGYEILISQDGSFHNPQVVSVKAVTQTSYFYPVGGSPQSFSFRIHSTSGTASLAQAKTGPDSGTVRHTSIDPSDVITKSTSIRDHATSDAIRATARLGRYTNSFLR